ncbi:hypothetical protein ACFLYT_00890 [Nanoarchaeota archaeon]
MSGNEELGSVVAELQHSVESRGGSVVRVRDGHNAQRIIDLFGVPNWRNIALYPTSMIELEDSADFDDSNISVLFYAKNGNPVQLKTVSKSDAPLFLVGMLPLEPLNEEPKPESVTRLVDDFTVDDILESGLGECPDAERVYIYTIDEMRFMSKYRFGSEGNADGMKEMVVGRARADICRSILTVDRAIINGFASSEIVESKYRHVGGALQLLEDSGLEKNTYWGDKLAELCHDSDPITALIGIKSLALRYIGSRDFLNPKRKSVKLTSAKSMGLQSDLAWVNNLMSSALGDQYVDSVVFGSFALYLRDKAKEYADHDLFVVVNDYENAINMLRGRKMKHEGKDVNVVLSPRDSFGRFMALKPDSIIQLYDGISINDKVRFPSPRSYGLDEGILYYIAACHNSLKGATAHLKEFKDALAATPDLLKSLSKIPLMNLECCLIHHNGYVPRKETERRYKDLIDSLVIEDDPRKMAKEAKTPEDAAKVIATAHFISTKVIRKYLPHKY